MKQKCMKRIVYVCMVCLVLSAISHVLEIPFLKHNKDNGFYFNIITINSVIAGFAFTNIGLLLSVSGMDIVKKVEGTDILQKKNRKLICSILFCTAAMFIGLPYTIDIGSIAGQMVPTLIVEIIADGFHLSIIVLLIIGMIYFLKAVLEISNLFAVIYPKQTIPQKRKDEIVKALKIK